MIRGLRARWEKFRARAQDRRTASERCARLERELRLKNSVNAALGAKVGRMERERALVFGERPGLSPAEIERLSLLAGACGGVAKAIEKTLRFGWESTSPYGGRSNRAAIEREVGALRAIVTFMIDCEDLHLYELQTWQRIKRASIAKWTLYQECSMPREAQLEMIAAIEEQSVRR